MKSRGENETSWGKMTNGKDKFRITEYMKWAVVKRNNENRGGKIIKAGQFPLSTNFTSEVSLKG